MEELVKTIYNEIYLRVYGEEYRFTNKSTNDHVHNFCKKLSPSIGDSWIREFIIFQFSFYSGMKTSFDRVFVNWILGDKALNRWENRTEQQSYYADQFKQSLGIRQEFTKLDPSNYEERERERFEDKERQFIHCHENLLFSISSSVCVKCINFEICKLHG